MEIYEQKLSAPQAGLSTRGLFLWLQEIANAQCVPLGLSGDDLKAKGLMWVVLRYLVRVERWPEAGEALRLQTWPGSTRHGMMPRFYRLLDENDRCIVSASSVWTVVDRATRKMVIPEEHGIVLEGLVTGLEERRPPAPARLETSESMDYTVTAEVLDANGHMNNTCYYDLAERCIGCVGQHPRTIITEHQSEIREGETMRVAWGREGGRFCLEGTRDVTVFRMELDYDGCAPGKASRTA